jgi:hypothetical protein
VHEYVAGAWRLHGDPTDRCHGLALPNEPNNWAVFSWRCCRKGTQLHDFVELAVDCIDARELHRSGYLTRRCVPRWPEFMGPGIDRIRFDRYLIQIDLCNQVTPQHIQITLDALQLQGR